ncbi:VPLPA-CTERM sorting domain-containing protein [Dongia sp.]|uniref:VPLPA-CTERM sorting domain-containing protein n=1 Tax=Dongia sp. TaxID=1977262 RepID=UPI0037513CEA
MRCTASRAMLAAGFLAAAATLPIGSADAAPVQFGNSYYEYVTHEAVSWDDASTAASASTFMGVNGHLATVTSSAENDFLLGLAPTPAFPQAVWLGGAVDSLGTARWAVGPEAGQLFTFSNFGGAEPDDGPSNVYMNIGATIAGILVGQWGDAAGGLSGGSSGGGSSSIGYFVEYQVSAVPLPAALPLMLTGLAGFGAVGWCRRRALGRVVAD